MKVSDETWRNACIRVLAGESRAEVALDTGYLTASLRFLEGYALVDGTMVPVNTRRSRTHIAQERKRDLEVDAGLILSRMDRNPDNALSTILRRDRGARINRALYSFFFEIVVSVFTAIIATVYISAVALLVAVEAILEPRWSRPELFGYLLAIGLLLLIVRPIYEWLVSLVWQSVGPFSLAVVALSVAQDRLDNKRGKTFNAFGEEPSSEAVRRQVFTALRVAERQLGRSLLIRPGYTTWAARRWDIRTRRQLGATFAYLEVELRREPQMYSIEAKQSIRTLEILSLLQDWSIEDLPTLEAPDDIYRGWARPVGAIVWAFLAFAIAAGSLALQVDWPSLLRAD